MIKLKRNGNFFIRLFTASQCYLMINLAVFISLFTSLILDLLIFTIKLCDEFKCRFFRPSVYIYIDKRKGKLKISNSFKTSNSSHV